MHIKSIVVGAAIALAATVGSASAADQFATLGGVTAEPMNAGEMAAVVGAVFIIGVNPPPGGSREVAVLDTDAPSVGLVRAEGFSDGIVVGFVPAGCPSPPCPSL